MNLLPSTCGEFSDEHQIIAPETDVRHVEVI